MDVKWRPVGTSPNETPRKGVLQSLETHPSRMWLREPPCRQYLGRESDSGSPPTSARRELVVSGDDAKDERVFLKVEEFTKGAS